MRVLVVTNSQFGLLKFRREVLEKMVQEKYKVFVSVPEDDSTQELTDIGVRVIHNKYLDRRGTNPISDLKLLNYYRLLMKKIKPDAVLTYTIKPNVYAGIVCGMLRIPYIANITGLGTAVQNGGIMQKITVGLYRIGLKNAQKVFCQNIENMEFVLAHKVTDEKKTTLLPGSGVNTKQHCYESYPSDREKVIFTTIGRIMRDKGINEILEAAEKIKDRYPNTEFRLIGDFDEDYESRVRELERKGVVKYLGFQSDIHKYMAESHAIIHASYHEGMSNVLQEAASTGRPVIATDVHGCIETYEPDVTGISFKAKNSSSLIEAIEKFMKMSNEDRAAMGKSGRRKMEEEFSREYVIEKYMEELGKAANRRK